MSEVDATLGRRQTFEDDVYAVLSIAAVPKILSAIRFSTGMRFVAVARVTEDRWIACQVHDEIDFNLPPGGELKVETTICNEVRGHRDTVAIDHVAKDDIFCGHPTPALYGFQSYVSTPITLPDGTFFGTLCAIDPKPALVNTSETINMFKLYAELIAFHLDAQERISHGAEVTKSALISLRLHENIVQSDEAPVCAFDHKYRLIAFNRAHSDEFFRIFNYRVQIGDVFPDLFPPDQAPVMRGFMTRALEGETYTVVEKFGDPELAKPYWEVMYTPLRNEAGEIIGAYHRARDISQRLRAEAELVNVQDALRQSQKMEAVGQLTGGVAHDFNNLLTIIRSATDFLRRKELPEDRRRRYVDAISDTVDRGSKLTGQLLAFARRQPLMPEIFDVDRQIESIVQLIRPLVGETIDIELHLAEDRCFARADISQFETAVVNFAVNGRDAMDGQGILTIRVRHAKAIPQLRNQPARIGSFVAVSMKDTGTGIATDTLDEIFQPFFTTKAVGKGTGLGLSQAFGFAHQSGGDIEVHSELGSGSTFTIYLPEVIGVKDSAPQMFKAVDASASGRGHRILVVEDNNDVGQLSTEMLQDLGYQITWVNNAREALIALEQDDMAFDLVFSDVIMPGMNGVELAGEIRRRYPGLPVVLTSGYSNVIAEHGHDGFDLIQKPYSVEALSRIMRRSIADRTTK